MLLDNYIGDFKVSVWLGQNLMGLTTPSPQTFIGANFASLYNAPVTIWQRTGDATCPMAIWVLTGDIACLFIGGCNSLQQGNDLWSGYLGGILSPRLDPRNEFLDVATAAINAWTPNVIFEQATKIICCGWSLGGAIAQLVAGSIHVKGLPITTRWLTFGSPRSGGTSVSQLSGCMQGVRWMFYTDPVPLLPPRTVDFPLLPAVYGIGPARRMEEFRHSIGGGQLGPGVNPIANELPSEASVNWPASIGAWLFGWDVAQGASSHSLSTYVQYMLNWLAANPTSNAQPDVAPVEPVGTSTSRELTQAERTVVQTIFGAGEAQNTSPPIQPPAQLLKAIKVGRVWYVVFGDQVVAIAGKRQRAQGLARSGNDMLRRLQMQPLVDTQQLTQQLGDYLTLAASATGGFVPPIRTEI